MRIRKLSGFAVLTVIAIGVSACGTASSSSSTSSSTAKSASTKTPYKIGVIFDTSGPGASLGSAETRGAQLMIDKINASGGVNGHQIDATFADGTSQPDRAVQLAQQMISAGDVAILGPSLAASCEAVRPLIEQAGVTEYCLSGAPFTWSPHFFATDFDPVTNLGTLPAYWMKEHGYTKAACIATSDASGDAYSKSFAATAPKQGVSIVDTEQFQSGATSVATQLTNVRSSGAQAIYGCVSGSNLATIINGMQSLGMNQPVWSGTGAASYAVANLVKNNLPSGGIYSLGTYIVVPNEIPANLPGGAAIKSYVASYKAKYNEAPDELGANAADAVSLISNALGHGATNGSAIATFLQNLHGFQGLNSVYSFSATNHRGTTPPGLVIQFTPQGSFKIAEKLNVAAALGS